MGKQDNYERYGTEWGKTVLKMSKAHMLEMIERIAKERDSLRFRLSVILQAENQEPDYDNPAEREADQRFADAPTPYDP